MTKLYTAPDHDFDSDCFVDATPSHMLPSWVCPRCARESGAGAGFHLCWANPAMVLDAVRLASTKYYRKPGKWLDGQGIQVARQRLREMAPCPIPVPPSTCFGPLQGKALASFRAVSGVSFRDIGATADQINAIAAKGISLAGYPAILRFPKKLPPEDIREIWAPPLGHVANRSEIEWCEECETGKDIRYEIPIVDASTIPKDVQVFRIWEYPSVLCVTEEFIEAISSLGINGVKWEPVKVA